MINVYLNGLSYSSLVHWFELNWRLLFVRKQLVLYDNLFYCSLWQMVLVLANHYVCLDLDDCF